MDLDLAIRKIVVLSEGCLDAIVLNRWEWRRDPSKQSQLWLDRQNRKIDSAMRAFNEMVHERKDNGNDFLVNDELTAAGIAVVCTVGFIDFTELRPQWKETYPVLKEWFERLDSRKEFAETRPVMFEMKETVVWKGKVVLGCGRSRESRTSALVFDPTEAFTKQKDQRGLVLLQAVQM